MRGLDPNWVRGSLGYWANLAVNINHFIPQTFGTCKTDQRLSVSTDKRFYSLTIVSECRTKHRVLEILRSKITDPTWGVQKDLISLILICSFPVSFSLCVSCSLSLSLLFCLSASHYLLPLSLISSRVFAFNRTIFFLFISLSVLYSFVLLHSVFTACLFLCDSFVSPANMYLKIIY